MGQRGSVLRRASVRVRTTAAAVLVVAIGLMASGIVLVMVVRGSLSDGVKSTAEQRADALVEQIRTTGLPPTSSSDAPEEDDPEGGDQEPEDLVWQVVDDQGRVLAASQSLTQALPRDDADTVRLPGGEHDYVVVTEEVGEDGDAAQFEAAEVIVAVSREDVDESTSALVGPLLIGLPLVLLLVGATTWFVVGRALTPVERIRSEVDQITGDRLDRRVPEPAAQDEVQRLAHTMNRMLGRLESSRTRQQQFVADASHELRSPLASIRQTAEVAVRHPGAMPEGELAAAVLEESERLQRLIEQLLLLTRADAGTAPLDLHEVDLDDLVFAAARQPVREDVRIDTTGVQAGRVHGVGIALGQVVRNLIDNAVRHARSTVVVSLSTAADGVWLSVEDDGAGIDEADRERVFERFVRLDEARSRDAGGSGLGLAIVRELVQAHGGQVGIEQAQLGGARFVVLLPGERL